MADHKTPRRCLADAEFHLRNAERSLKIAAARAPDAIVEEEAAKLRDLTCSLKIAVARVRARLSHEPVLSGSERA